MNKIKRNYVILMGIFIILIFLSLNNKVLAKDKAIKYELKTVPYGRGSTKVNVVTIDMNNENMKAEVITANDAVSQTESVHSMIKRKNPDVLINANYFNAYSRNGVYEPHGSIIKNNDVVSMIGTSSSFYIDKDNKADINYFSTTISGYTGDINKNYWDNSTDKMSFNTFAIWYLNTKPVDKTGVYLYTPDYGKSASFNYSGLAIVVKDNVVTHILDRPAGVNIPKNGYIIYYANRSANGDYKNYANARFSVGDKVTLTYNMSIKDSNDKIIENIDNLEVKQLVSGGPYLVENGKNVSQNYLKHFTEAKILSQRAQRSAIGITEDNKVILVTKSAMTIDQMAEIMINLNCKKAMCLDGGASSALYVDNKLITRPARRLNTALSFSFTNN